MTNERITVKAFLSDGTKLTKVMWLTKSKDPKSAIMKEFETYLDNVILRIPI